MIRHVVLWRWTHRARDEGLDSVLAKIGASCERMSETIEGLRCCEARPNLSEGDYDLLFYCEFGTRRDLRDFLEHPLHSAHREMAKDYVCDRITVDVEA